MKRHQEKKHAENRMGLNDEEPEEVDDDGDVGDCGASDGECEKAGQDSSDSFEDLPEVIYIDNREISKLFWGPPPSFFPCL